MTPNERISIGSRRGLMTIALMAVSAVPGLCQQKGADAVPSAKILTPKDGDAVGQTFEVRVALANIPKDCQIVAATQIGDLYWPKEPEFSTTERESSITFGEFGRLPGNSFSVSILLIPVDGKRFLDKWFDNGKNTDDWPGLNLQSITGAERLATVKVKLR